MKNQTPAYIPSHFLNGDQAQVRELIQKNSFATVLSFPENEKPFVNHLPVIFSSRPGEENILIGHMAKRNPQWAHFKKNPDCTLIFHGPHTYITPSWYTSGRNVPTWNYVVAHVHGKIKLRESFEDQIEVLEQLTRVFESENPEPWEFELPSDLADAQSLTSAIISFEFHIENIEAKFKLSQNRNDQDRFGVIDGLSQRTDEMSHRIREMMIKLEKKESAL